MTTLLIVNGLNVAREIKHKIETFMTENNVFELFLLNVNVENQASLIL